MSSHSRIPIVALTAFLAPALAAVPGQAQGQAPGTPYVDCTDAVARYDRLASGLPVQQEAVDRAARYLDALRAERRAGTREAREQLEERTADMVKSDAAAQLEALTKARDAVLKSSSPAAKSDAVLGWMRQVSALEDSVGKLVAIPNAARAGWNYGQEVQKQGRTVAEQLASANKLFVESGLAEAVGSDLAKAFGPAGIVAFNGSLYMLDKLVADQADWDRALEEQRAADNLNSLTQSLHRVEDRMQQLKGDCPAQFKAAEDTAKPPAATTTAPQQPPPAAPPAQEAPAVKSAKKASGGSGSKAPMMIVGTTVLVGGAIWAGSALANTIGGSCVSNRFCIVSVMSSGCECAGTVNGECGWTGATAGEGQACGAGVACEGGLSCNNGRCEGPNGRCPF